MTALRLGTYIDLGYLCNPSVTVFSVRLFTNQDYSTRSCEPFSVEADGASDESR